MSAEAKASRPHGIPPNGQPDRHTSTATQSAAVHTGQPRRRDTAAQAPPSGTKKAVSRVESISQASQPTDRIQNRCTNMNAAPVSSPSHSPRRTRTPWTASVKPATPTGSSTGSS